MPLPLLLQCHVHDQSERRMNNRDDVDEEAIATYCYTLLKLPIATVSVHGSKCVLFFNIMESLTFQLSCSSKVAFFK